MEQTAAELETTKPTRGQMIWQKIRDARDTAPISLWRARLYTEAFKKTEGMPQPLRIAKSVENVVKNIPIYLDDEQMLAGDPSTWTSGAELHLENSVDWIKRELEAGRPPVGVSEGEVEELKEIVAYWDAKGLKSGFVACLGEEMEERLEKAADPGARVYMALAQMSRSKGWYSPNYEKAIKLGFSGLLEEVENELRNDPPLDDDTREKSYLLRALTIELKALMEYIKRYAVLTKDLAEKEEEPRKSELLKIADVCDYVSENPARGFHDALQILWFVHVMGEMDCGLVGWSPGRVDQYLYPYYSVDIENGDITDEEVIDLLECFRVKMSSRRSFENVYGHMTSAGEGLFHNCTLGGQKADGSDAVNELTFLWLEAAFRVRSPHPTLSVRYHKGLNEKFALKAAELASRVVEADDGAAAAGELAGGAKGARGLDHFDGRSHGRGRHIGNQHIAVRHIPKSLCDGGPDLRQLVAHTVGMPGVVAVDLGVRQVGRQGLLDRAAPVLAVDAVVRARALDDAGQEDSHGAGGYSSSPWTMGTNRTGRSLMRRTLPSSLRRMTRRWKPVPTGMIMRPPSCN